MLGAYKSLGFESIVASMQAKYPPRGPTPSSVMAATTISELLVGNTMRYEFLTGSNGELWYRTIDSKATAFASLGGKGISSAPKAVLRQDGVIFVFVRGSDGLTWVCQTVDNGKTWSWESIGGKIFAGSNIEAVSYSQNNLVVYVEGSNGNDVWQCVNDGKTWSGWTQYIAKLA
jgi:hypothetical protein